jgi:hypothetical protein
VSQTNQTAATLRSEENSATPCVARRKNGSGQCCKPARYLINGRALCAMHTPRPERVPAFEISP